MTGSREALALGGAFTTLKLFDRVINSRKTINKFGRWQIGAQFLNPSEAEYLLKLFQLRQKVSIENPRDSKPHELRALRSYIHQLLKSPWAIEESCRPRLFWRTLL